MVHRYANRGDPLIGADRVPYDKPSQQRLLGGSAQGLSPEEYAAATQRLLGTTVDTGAEAKVTPASLMSTSQRAAALGQTPPPGAGGGPSPPIPGGGGGRSAAPAGGGARPLPAAPVPSRPARQQALIDELHNPATAGAFTAGAPVAPKPGAPAAPAAKNLMDFSDAPNKPSFVDNPNVVKSKDQNNYADKYQDKKIALQDDAGQVTDTQRQLVEAQRMLNLLPNAKVGPGSERFAELQTLLGNMTGSQFVHLTDSNPAAYAMLQKALGNDALQQRLQEFREKGAQVRLGAAESGVILNKLSAGTGMPANAIKSLLGWHVQELNWEQRRQNAINPYLDQGKNALQFDNYYAGKHPLTSALSTAAPPGTTVTRPGQQYSGPTASGQNGERYHLINNQWVKQWSLPPLPEGDDAGCCAAIRTLPHPQICRRYRKVRRWMLRRHRTLPHPQICRRYRKVRRWMLRQSRRQSQMQSARHMTRQKACRQRINSSPAPERGLSTRGGGCIN